MEKAPTTNRYDQMTAAELDAELIRHARVRVKLLEAQKNQAILRNRPEEISALAERIRLAEEYVAELEAGFVEE